MRKLRTLRTIASQEIRGHMVAVTAPSLSTAFEIKLSDIRESFCTNLSISVLSTVVRVKFGILVIR